MIDIQMCLRMSSGMLLTGFFLDNGVFGAGQKAWCHIDVKLPGYVSGFSRAWTSVIVTVNSAGIVAPTVLWERKTSQAQWLQKAVVPMFWKGTGASVVCSVLASYSLTKLMNAFLFIKS
jgi:hypothetical protein